MAHTTLTTIMLAEANRFTTVLIFLSISFSFSKWRRWKESCKVFGLPALPRSSIWYDRTSEYLADMGKFFMHFDNLGTDCFYSFLLGRHTVVVRGHENVEYLLMKQGSDLGPGWMPSVELLLGSSAVLAVSGAEHRRLRRALASTVTVAKVQIATSRMAELALEEIRQWDNGPFDALVFIPKLVLRMTTDIAFGEEFVKQHLDSFSKDFQTLSKGLFSMVIPLPGTKFTKARQAGNRLRKIFNCEVAKHKKLRQVGYVHDLNLEKSVIADFTSQELLDFEVVDSLLNALLASFAPTASLAMTAIEQLALNNDHMQRIRAELESQLGLTVDSSPEVIAKGLQHIGSLPFLTSFVMEVGFYRPVTPAVWRRALRDIETIEGFKIPKNWYVLISFEKTMKSSPMFQGNVDNFNPDRFLGKKGPTLTGKDAYQYLVYGAGNRGCPGARMASTQIAIIVALISLSHKKLKLADGSPQPEWAHVPAPQPIKGLRLQVCN